MGVVKPGPPHLVPFLNLFTRTPRCVMWSGIHGISRRAWRGMSGADRRSIPVSWRAAAGSIDGARRRRQAQAGFQGRLTSFTPFTVPFTDWLCGRTDHVAPCAFGAKDHEIFSDRRGAPRIATVGKYRRVTPGPVQEKQPTCA